MNTFKKYLIFILGIIVFGFGICLGNKSLLGGNPMSIFVVGVSKKLVVSVGLSNFIVGIFEAGIGYILDKKNVTFATILGLVCGSYAIDFAGIFIHDTSVLSTRIIYMVLGILCYCFGLSLQHYAKCGYGNLDCFNFGLMKAFNIKKYHTVRWIVDGSFIVLGFLLGGIFNIGTVLLLLFGGYIIETLSKLLNKLLG